VRTFAPTGGGAPGAYLPTVPFRVAICAAALAGALSWGCLAASSVQAAFLPIELQSVGPGEQFEEANEPAISGNGEYLAFEGALAGAGGVWLKNLHNNTLRYIAGGTAPSISADGRYVSFTTSEQLVTQAQPGSNVYVRDMTVEPAFQGPCDEAQENAGRCPYELASALNESTEGIAYEGSGGSSATGRASLSADGREIAFTLGGTSNLTSGRRGSTPGTPTPGGQIAVRYLNTHRTVLVTAKREADGEMSELPVVGGAMTQTGAALSGDGSTVAWLGAHIPAQAPTLEGERQQIEHLDEQPPGDDEAYDEPLWRRIEDGPSAPTRRMVGGGDPLAPGCPPDGTIEVPACQGPYPKLAEDERSGFGSNLGWLGIAGYDGIPHLSYNGWSAALVGDPDGTADVFAVNMHDGLDRVQALRELTPEVPVEGKVNPGFAPEHVATAGDVYEAAISPDGSRIAFTTQRQQFPLAPLVYDEEPAGQVGVVELYEIVDGQTLERVTRGPHDGASLEAGGSGYVTAKGASAPSFTEGGQTLAFADTASNLVYGDSNGASDVFTATEAGVSGTSALSEYGPPPPGREPAVPLWRLSVVAVTHADGSVTLDAVVPGPGRVNVSATAVVPVAAPAHTARAAHGSARGQAARKRSKPARRVKLAALRSRTVSTGQMSAAAPGLLELPLHVWRPYARLLSTPAGIYATVHVTFAGPGGPPLTQTVTVSLRKTGRPRVARARRSVASKRHLHQPERRGR
jgi:Tol biopolymer transport system component